MGLTPSYGLVPDPGIFPIDLTVDHAGPMARTVEDCALWLAVRAGPDGLDPRQDRGHLQGQAYTNALIGDAKGLRLGLVAAGVAWPGASQPEVDRLVRQSALRLKEVRAEVYDVSIPMHREAGHLAFGSSRGRPGADDPRRWHGDRLAGPLARAAPGFLRPQPPGAGERLLAHGEAGHADGPVPAR